MSSTKSGTEPSTPDSGVQLPSLTHSASSKEEVIIDWRPSTVLPVTPVVPTDVSDDHDPLHLVLSHILEHHYPTTKEVMEGGSGCPDLTRGDTVDYDRDEIYDRFTPFEKAYMTAIVAFCSLCAPFSIPLCRRGLLRLPPPRIHTVGVGRATSLSGPLTWAMIHRGEAWQVRVDALLQDRDRDRDRDRDQDAEKGGTSAAARSVVGE